MESSRAHQDSGMRMWTSEPLPRALLLVVCDVLHLDLLLDLEEEVHGLLQLVLEDLEGAAPNPRTPILDAKILDAWFDSRRVSCTRSDIRKP